MGRIKRTTRTSRPPVLGKFRWNSRRETLLELFAQFYVLRISDLVRLLDLPDNDSSRRNIQYRLSMLMEHGYISRLRFFDDSADNPCLVYAYFLTEKGAKRIEDDSRAFTIESKIITRHEIEITQFHINLALWAAKQGFLIDWHQPKIDHNRAINPDAYFGIEDPAKPEGRNVLHFFLEMERAKIGNYRNGEPSIVRKLAKYHEFYDSQECAKEWGFQKFRVVTVVRNTDKQNNLCERLSKEFAHRMFWITNEHSAKESIGSEIFKTPKDWITKAYAFVTPS